MVHTTINRSPTTPITPEELRRLAKQLPDTRQEVCELEGGTWDPIAETCTQPTPPPEPVKPNVPETFRSSETGRLSGVTLPSGETFLGLGPTDVRGVVAGQADIAAQPQGSAPVGTAQTAAVQTQRKIALAKSVGVIDFQTVLELEAQGLNVRELVSAGFQNIDLFRPAAAIAAGLSSAPVTAGIGPVTGFVVAGSSIINDFQKGIRSNIKAQRGDLVSLKTRELRQRKLAITNYISNANLNPAAADDMVLAMNIELSLIARDYAILIRISEPNLEFWGGDATTQIADYDAFFVSVQPSLEDRMRQAIARPDPTRAFLDLGEIR